MPICFLFIKVFANYFSIINLCYMRSGDVIFMAAFGDENKVVNLSSPNGAGGNCYHIMIDNSIMV